MSTPPTNAPSLTLDDDPRLRDTGWVLVPPENGWTSTTGLRLRRIGRHVFLTGYPSHSSAITSDKILSLPIGYRPSTTMAFVAPSSTARPAPMQLVEVSSVGVRGYNISAPLAAGTIYLGGQSWISDDPFPS